MVQHCFGPIPTLEFVQSQMIQPCLVQKLQIHQLLCLPKSAHYLYSNIYQPMFRHGQIICFYTNSNAEIGPKQCLTSGLLRYFFFLQCIFARSVTSAADDIKYLLHFYSFFSPLHLIRIAFRTCENICYFFPRYRLEMIGEVIIVTTSHCFKMLLNFDVQVDRLMSANSKT